MLHFANMGIDAVQSAKRTWVQTFVPEDSVRLPLYQFIDAQSDFTKQVAKTYWEVTGAAAETFVKKFFVSK